MLGINGLIHALRKGVKRSIILQPHSLIISLLYISIFYLIYPQILLADSKNPDQSASVDRLIWVFTVHLCPKGSFLHGTALIYVDCFIIYCNNPLMHNFQTYTLSGMTDPSLFAKAFVSKSKESSREKLNKSSREKLNKSVTVRTSVYIYIHNYMYNT